MWLYESLVKEFHYKCLESALRVGVMEGVYLNAAPLQIRDCNCTKRKPNKLTVTSKLKQSGRSRGCERDRYEKG